MNVQCDDIEDGSEEKSLEINTIHDNIQGTKGTLRQQNSIKVKKPSFIAKQNSGIPQQPGPGERSP